MRRLSPVVGVAVLFCGSAHAMTEQEFQARAQALKVQQKGADAWINRLGGGLGFSPGLSPATGRTEEAEKPLVQIHGDLSSSKLPVGKLLYGKTLNRLVVTSDASPVLVVLDSGQGPVSGARLLGSARQSATPGRVGLELSRVLFPSGRTVGMQGLALDAQGASGIEAEVFSSKALAVAGAMASSFVSGLAASQQTQNVNALGFSTPQVTGRNAVLQGLAQTAADQSKRLIEDATAAKPVLVLESNTPVVVLVQEELRL